MSRASNRPDPGTIQCDGCGASFRADARECEYCGAARPSAPAPPPSADDLRDQLRTAQESMQEPVPGFWWLHGGIFILVGLIFTSTIIGAIVGIPAIWIGINSWRKGARARR